MRRFLLGSGIKIFSLLLTFCLISLFLGFKQANAALINISYSPSPPPSQNKVSDSFCAGVMQECWNSEKVGVTGCGTACTGGSPWTKYKYDSCYTDPERTGFYIAWLPKNDVVYSTADKCSDGSKNPPAEAYLKGGNCSGIIGGIYKTCCSNTSPSYLLGGTCSQVRPSQGAPYPPWDGVCPGGHA